MICPLCGEEYFERSALSRRDNKTKICPMCGTKEAMLAAGWTEEKCNEAIEKLKSVKDLSDEAMR